MDPELQAALDAFRDELMSSVSDNAAQVKALMDRLDDEEKKANRPGASATNGETLSPLAAAEKKALNDWVRSADPKVFQPNEELKAMMVGSDPDGGYTVLPNMSSGMTKRIFDQSPMRRLAHVETITRGDSWEEPLDDDDLGSAWVSETEERPDTSTPQVAMLRVPVHEQYAMPRVTQQLLEDSSWDVAKWLEGKAGDRFGRQEGITFVTGNGIKKPRGFLDYDKSLNGDTISRPRGALQYIISGHATLITADALRSLTWTLRAPYRSGASWLMNSATAGTIDKLKNGNGDYIWRDGMTAGAAPALLGYPVTIDENMPDIAAGAFPIAFGNFKLGFIIIDKLGLRVLADPYTSKPWVKFYTRKRVGGAVRNTDAIKLLKIEA